MATKSGAWFYTTVTVGIFQNHYTEKKSKTFLIQKIEASMSSVKPCTITIEWDGPENFYFRCDYRTPDHEPTATRSVDSARSLPFMTQAMGNVLRKLRKEHISFPLFLMAVAFNHRNLLNEIDQLLHLLHQHLEKEQSSGTFSCYVASEKKPIPLKSHESVHP